MFKKLFFRDVQEEEEKVFDTVDPVVEQRRKEKFSAPLIYDEEVEIKIEKEVKPEKKEIKKENKPYEMSQIISPIGGLKKSKVDESIRPKPVPKKVKKRKMEDQLVPVISPFYGPADLVVEEAPEPQKIKKAKPELQEETVEDNLRNIASIIEEEKDQLRIIEERTGEFKLDFSNQESDSLIDEIDDSMSLDELMSLYEKKFKD
ncbi:MAG: hypothetical protein U0L85_08930 [Bacilli bacterium]|nr:hypothetical protein [Bacilli bacterium]